MSDERNDNEMNIVLIVEDSTTQAAKLKYHLEASNYIVLMANDGIAALNLLKTTKPSAVVSDIIMPGMNGYELCQQIKSDPSMKDIPVILLTSLSDPEDVLLGLECKADYFIEKSNDLSILLSCLRNQKVVNSITSDEENLLDFEITFNDHKYSIKSCPVKILKFLLTTYEVAIMKNNELILIDQELNKEMRAREKLAEELKKAKESAEVANQAKSNFLASMSHEIRTPMNAILGFSQLMLRDSSISEEQKNRLTTINRSGEHLLALINDILDISKVEAGKVSINMKTFNLHRFFKDIENMFRIRSDEKNIRLIFEISEELLEYVITDEGKLRQIFLNLLSNAVKFTQDGGVAVRVKTEFCGNNKYKLTGEVEDTGPGIPEKDINSIFDVFQQTETGIKEGGTGLGLALSKQFSKLLGGDITVDSKVGTGSRFKITIELLEGKGEDVEAVSVQKNVIGTIQGNEPHRVLVADDKHENREFLKQLLKSVGFDVRLAVDGLEAISIFESWSPQLILMDMKMPKLDGYEATKRIKATQKGKETSIMIITATAFDDDLHQLLESGADNCIRKPFKINEFFEAVEKCIDVKYIYENERLDKTASEKKHGDHLKGDIPDKLIKEMHDATVNAQLDKLIDLINSAGSLLLEDDSEWLKSMALSYQYEALIKLFKKEGDTNE